ncbi:MAG TPA: GTPase HflX [Patescibacteria group bacterium]|nr:GTPase HflX [Patescibacteria group bacterium]
MHETQDPREKAFLVGVEFTRVQAPLTVEESLGELARLADTAGLAVVGQATQRLRQPDNATYIGSGKVTEIKSLISEFDADVVLFDDELRPRHQRELEKAFGDEVRVLDRTALILDIFALHASTKEGKLQVELAQLEYRLPRLTRMWTHLARQAGGRAGGARGGVGLRGPGETQLEVDRREISRRITTLKTELEGVRAHRGRHRAKRRQTEIQVISIVGYTNSGKSTLLNQLSNADVLSADMLFATLDPTTRKVKMPGGREVLFTDTVGFIQKLPPDIVAAFRATLEEITESDLLLHVVDATHPQAAAQMESVEEILAELEIDHLPQVVALNKVDLLSEDINLAEKLAVSGVAVPISALTGKGLSMLLTAIEAVMEQNLESLTIKLPYQRGDLLSLFHERGQVNSEDHLADGVIVNGRLPDRLIPYFEEFRLVED